MNRLRVALLHLLPIAGDIEYNQQLLEKAVGRTKGKDVDWIITPELAVSGLQFSSKIGTDWIKTQPDEWMSKFSRLVKSVNANLFLGCPERGENGNFYNTVFVINKSGELVGKQRKISSVTDNWSSGGTCIEPIDLNGLKVGILICADAYTPDIADRFFAKGAELLIAPSAWGPGLYGPAGEWEQRSLDTGLPLFVCNRTGEDETVSFWEADSSIIKDGKRLLAHKSRESVILTFDWDLDQMELISDSFEVERL